MRDLTTLKERIEKHPTKIAMQFEDTVKSELGVVEGQAQTLKD